VVLRAAAPESRFGFALSSAGDVNADGYQVYFFLFIDNSVSCRSVREIK
jgi:hypothetical protein